jgi:4-diphosphocytidyl-2-C-methyl-D-erythritol kinase
MFIHSMKAIQLFSPAKINLFLSVFGPRGDGFHELLSLACPLDFGDQISLEIHAQAGADLLKCDLPGLPLDGSNLILQAVCLFRSQLPFPGRVIIDLRKMIPMGAGLGGGSSNAAAVLWGLNVLLGNPLEREVLLQLASELGSDCPLFLEGGAVILRGRGEQVLPVNQSSLSRLMGRVVLLLLSDLHISTSWAYGRFQGLSDNYATQSVAETHLSRFQDEEISLESFLFNSFEPVVFEKFTVLQTVKVQLQDADCGPALLSGSGSSMFMLLPKCGLDGTIEEKLFKDLEDSLGPDLRLVKARLAPFFPEPFKLQACSNDTF